MDEHKIGDDPVTEGTEREINWSDLGEVYSPPIKPLDEFLPQIDLSDADKNVPTLLFFETIAHQRMLDDACRDTSREHGGILTGEACKGPSGQFYVLIKDAIAATDSQGSSTHLQFRAESWKPVWDHLHSNPSVQILGWYHTHPGLGVFLSGTDLRTQRLYFGSPWNIAVVIDPIARKIGYFFGEEGKRVKFFKKLADKADPQNTVP
jgi:proteasome lid subunit RPN8/RPN11